MERIAPTVSRMIVLKEHINRTKEKVSSRIALVNKLFRLLFADYLTSRSLFDLFF